MAGICACGNEPLGSIQCGEFLDWLRAGLLLRKDSALWLIQVVVLVVVVAVVSSSGSSCSSSSHSGSSSSYSCSSSK